MNKYDNKVHAGRSKGMVRGFTQYMLGDCKLTGQEVISLYTDNLIRCEEQGVDVGPFIAYFKGIDEAMEEANRKWQLLDKNNTKNQLPLHSVEQMELFKAGLPTEAIRKRYGVTRQGVALKLSENVQGYKDILVKNRKKLKELDDLFVVVVVVSEADIQTNGDRDGLLQYFDTGNSKSYSRRLKVLYEDLYQGEHQLTVSGKYAEEKEYRIGVYNRLIKDGKTQREIADELGISANALTHTLKTPVDRLVTHAKNEYLTKKLVAHRKGNVGYTIQADGSYVPTKTLLVRRANLRKLQEIYALYKEGKTAEYIQDHLDVGEVTYQTALRTLGGKLHRLEVHHANYLITNGRSSEVDAELLSILQEVPYKVTYYYDMFVDQHGEYSSEWMEEQMVPYTHLYK